MARAKPITGIDPDAPLLISSALIIGVRLGEMLVWERFIKQPDRVYELHQMRIAAKRLRYTMEIFQDAYTSNSRFGKTFDKATEEVKSLQERLGEIHDADVLVPQLTQHIARLAGAGFGKDENGPIAGVHHVDFEAIGGLLTLCEEARQSRETHYQLLTEDWDRLASERYFERLRALLRDAIAELPLDQLVPSQPWRAGEETSEGRSPHAE